MAQKRKKKPQKPAPFSPARYLREKARTFPILGCFCSSNWQERGLVQTMVVREQPSGKLLMGIFLVDTYCLGIKSASYHVNLEEEKVTEMLEIMGENEESPLISCDYVLLHNLIYGALAYAEEIGFFPDPDFGVARYMLEEDTDEIELMDLEFGKDGQPFFVAGPYDNVNRILVTLERKVGKGNFSYLLNIGGI